MKFLTPYQRRSGLSDKILDKRRSVYEAAKAAHPERWNGREIRDWSLPDTVYLNPDKMNGQKTSANLKKYKFLLTTTMTHRDILD